MITLSKQKDFFKNLGKKGFDVSKKIAKDVLSNPGRALDLTSKIATAAASRNSKHALSSLPELTTFYNTGKGLYLSKFAYTIVIKWTRKQVDYTHQHHLKIKILILNKDQKRNK